MCVPASKTTWTLAIEKIPQALTVDLNIVKKVFWLAFGCAQHLKAGPNTQHDTQIALYETVTSSKIETSFIQKLSVWIPHELIIIIFFFF